jgi:GNAT superfamily N-acetyltransferase
LKKITIFAILFVDGTNKGKSMKNITIRIANEKDAEGIFHVHRESVLNVEDYLYSNKLKEIWAPENSIRAHKITTSEKYYTLVAVHKNKVVGFGAIYKGELNLLYVLPTYQKQGIATALLEQLEQKLIKPIEVKVPKNSVHFYTKKGYKIQAKTNVLISNHILDTFLALKA